MMAPAEIVSSLKELCENQGPRLSTIDIVDWIDKQSGYESDIELIAFGEEDEGAAVCAHARL